MSDDAVCALKQGVRLRNETRPVQVHALDLLDATTVRVTVREGRYHLVRRLFAAVGNRVLSLHREAIAELELDPALEAGQWRELHDTEVALGNGG